MFINVADIQYYRDRIQHYEEKGFPGYSARMLAFFDVGAVPAVRPAFDKAVKDSA